jgi:hypothetical protein
VFVSAGSVFARKTLAYPRRIARKCKDRVEVGVTLACTREWGTLWGALLTNVWIGGEVGEFDETLWIKTPKLPP